MNATVAASSSLHIFNTLTRKKEVFTPVESGKVGLYTCGPTVYDYAHIGNFRAFLFEDLLKRWLEHQGFQVTHVMNITDIDDKTIKGSQAQQKPLRQYTDFYVDAFFEDIKTLNIKPATVYPRATDHIPEMVNIIKILLENGVAYHGEDGSIYFAINKFPRYGKLSHIKKAELKTGARVKQDEYAKEEAQDFALWKAYTPQDGDVCWETEIGKGRPGWHLECSAMSMKYLGETFDIHCGGIDNMFPHHENEIAQSEAATGKPFVHYWMHNDHLLVEGKKMSKSYGNYYTLRDLLQKNIDPIALRYLLLSTHYRQQFNFTFEGLDAAKGAIERLANLQRRLQDANGTANPQTAELIAKVQTEFSNALNDDLNISIALAALFDFVRDVNNLLDANALNKEDAQKIQDTLSDFDSVLGVIPKPAKEEALPAEVEELIRRREEARKAKDWKTADALRDKLKDLGITIEDTAQGIRWKREKT
ncbi:MAG: cysteine--tRNA ligase [Candidatus Bathyarchaeota archaeon]|nr:cysteine--tRNA ligase [Candidatus Bathyarchaeota archaeon]